MENEEIAVKITEHTQEIKSLKHRMNEVEEMTASINKLAISVERLAMSVNTMISRQDKYDARLKSQGERIGMLERAPDKADAEKWKSIVKTAITVIVSTLVGIVMAQLF